MKLDTRRTVRRWLLSLPSSTPTVLKVGSAAFAGLGLLIETLALTFIGFLGLFGLAYLHGQVRHDACPNCRVEVDVFDERYCPTCGARLDDVEAAPPIDERLEELFRPRELEQIEQSPPVDAIADGGSYEEEEVTTDGEVSD